MLQGGWEHPLYAGRPNTSAQHSEEQPLIDVGHTRAGTAAVFVYGIDGAAGGTCRLTTEGSDAFGGYVDLLEGIVKQARKTK